MLSLSGCVRGYTLTSGVVAWTSMYRGLSPCPAGSDTGSGQGYVCDVSVCVHGDSMNKRVYRCVLWVVQGYMELQTYEDVDRGTAQLSIFSTQHAHSLDQT